MPYFDAAGRGYYRPDTQERLAARRRRRLRAAAGLALIVGTTTAVLITGHSWRGTTEVTEAAVPDRT